MSALSVSFAFHNKLSLSLSLQVGNLGLLFMLLFFIFAALGVELFGDLSKHNKHTYIRAIFLVV